MNELDYAYVEWKHWDENSFGQFTDAQARYFAAETSITATREPRVLEIGFGNGSFLGWVKSLGGTAFGIETNPVLVARANRLLGDVRAFDGLSNSSVCDLRGAMTHIVGFDVIEHISFELLPSVLSQLRELLTPDGRIILRFPNGDSPFGRITQHGDPTHVTTIGQQKLEFLAREAGLDICQLRAPAMPIRGGTLGAAGRRCLIKAARWAVEKAIGLMYFQGRYVPLDPNYVAILVRGK
jgi:SAM-dependent methyltransferase